jgi:hypothetical protein
MLNSRHNKNVSCSSQGRIYLILEILMKAAPIFDNSNDTTVNWTWLTSENFWKAAAVIAESFVQVALIYTGLTAISSLAIVGLAWVGFPAAVQFISSVAMFANTTYAATMLNLCVDSACLLTASAYGMYHMFSPKKVEPITQHSSVDSLANYPQNIGKVYTFNTDDHSDNNASYSN